jgi:tRNA1(Val) A37 N6-methylase TrmN6
LRYIIRNLILQDSEKYRFNNYLKIAEILQGLYSEDKRGNTTILDIGAGTGLVAKEARFKLY